MNHIWLVLSDSALPLGSFAFSSGLESFSAHTSSKSSSNASASVTRFLRLSLLSTANSTLPFVIASYNSPEHAIDLDDSLDASTTCGVARRASVSQGRALLTVWERALKTQSLNAEHVESFRRAVRKGEANAHFPIVWGLVTSAFRLKLEDVMYVFMFNHTKAVLSAAVRLGLVGPYISQGMLAMESTREMVKKAVEEGGARAVEGVGQTVPSFDVYQGRHELLYSRVFNS